MQRTIIFLVIGIAHHYLGVPNIQKARVLLAITGMIGIPTSTSIISVMTGMPVMTGIPASGTGSSDEF